MKLYVANGDEDAVESLLIGEGGRGPMAEAPNAADSSLEPRTDALAGDPYELIERAITMARVGERDEARALACALTSSHPGNTTILHKFGVVLQLSGDYHGALEAFRSVLKLKSDFSYAHLEIGNTLASLGKQQEALASFLNAVESDPACLLAYRRAAQIHRQLDQHGAALKVLSAAHAVDPTDPGIVSDVADCLVYHHRREDASKVYETLLAAGRARGQDLAHYLNLLTELGRYEKVIRIAGQVAPNTDPALAYAAEMLAGHAKLATSVDRPTLVATSRARQMRGSWLYAAGVWEALRDALAAEEPFSLVRIGDGEGRFLAYCDPRTWASLTRTEAYLLGEVCWRNWFGVPLSQADQYDIVRLQAAVVGAIENATVLGVTPADRLEADNLHFGYLSYLEGLVANLTHTHPRLMMTGSNIHAQLHQLDPFYRKLLSAARFICVISPHPGLAGRIGSLVGVRDAFEHIIPGESRLPDNARGRDRGAHYPSRYIEICGALENPRRGGFYLVAAGLLGKVYCEKVRQGGGIAIDVGAVADAWMGYDTRPGQFVQRSEWQLP